MRWSRTPRRKSRRRRPRASRSLAAGRSGFQGEAAPAERIRDDLASGLADAPKTALTSHLFGAPHEGRPVALGCHRKPLRNTPRVVAHVGRGNQARGTCADAAAQTFRPGVLGPDGPLGFATRSGALAAPRDALVHRFIKTFTECY